jgi:hypothetical protein
MTEQQDSFFSSAVFGDPGVFTAITPSQWKGRRLVGLASTGLRFAASTVVLTSALALHDVASTPTNHLIVGTEIAAYSGTATGGPLRKPDPRVFVHRSGRRGRHSRDTVDWSVAPTVPLSKKIRVFPRRIEVRKATPAPVIDDPTE